MAKKPTELELAGPLEAVFKNPEQVRENIKIFRAAVTKILDPKVDIAIIHDKPFTRKSGWDATNAYFGVKTKPISSWVIQLPDGEYTVSVAVEASGAGREPVARSGTCTSIEMKAKHQGKDFMGLFSACHGMAETRAVGRASSSFFMVADVSAEEVEDSPGPMKKEGEELTQKSKWCMCDLDKIKISDDETYCLTCSKPLSENQVKTIKKAK